MGNLCEGNINTHDIAYQFEKKLNLRRFSIN